METQKIRGSYLGFGYNVNRVNLIIKSDSKKRNTMFVSKPPAIIHDFLCELRKEHEHLASIKL